MDENSSGATAVWQVPECPVSVEYAPDVLDRIRLLVLEAFYAFPRGGAEVGGVLFGRHERGRVHITAFRGLTCEHAFGPSFVLSANDRARLQKLLAAESDPALAGAAPVGWYHSHTRSEIFLSEQDLEIHRQYFPEPWQIALVLRPSIAGTRAGFFVADAEGKLRADASYREFPVAALGGRALARADQQPREQPVVRPAPAPEPPAAAVPPGEPVPPPAFLARSEPPRAKPLWPWVLAGIAAGFGATLFFTRDHWLELVRPSARVRAERAEPLALRAEEIGGQVLIRWNPAAPQVLRARTASLEIVDGQFRNSFPLAPELLRSGVFSRIRRTEKVEVRLTLDGAAESAVFAGKPPDGTAQPGSTEELVRERDVLRNELMQARTQLLNQTLLIENQRRTIQQLQSGGSTGKPAPATAPAAQR